jgi:hypothetical protein
LTVDVAAVYGENFSRLAALKAKLDPTNFFRHAMWDHEGAPSGKRQNGDGVGGLQYGAPPGSGGGVGREITEGEDEVPVPGDMFQLRKGDWDEEGKRKESGKGKAKDMS